MKIFRLFPNNKTSGEPLNKEMALQVLPDTALLIQKRPFFIPDFTQCCKAQLCYVVRINRLGRSIFEKFSHRYYDSSSITLGVHFIATDLLKDLQDGSYPWDMATGFDNAVAVSEKKVENILNSTVLKMSINGQSVVCSPEKELFSIVDCQIARISSFYTLRQGDLLLFPVEMEPKQVQIDDRIVLSSDSQELLTFNVK